MPHSAPNKILASISSTISIKNVLIVFGLIFLSIAISLCVVFQIVNRPETELPDEERPLLSSRDAEYARRCAELLQKRKVIGLPNGQTAWAGIPDGGLPGFRALVTPTYGESHQPRGELAAPFVLGYGKESPRSIRYESMDSDDEGGDSDLGSLNGRFR
jgi:hypothetical protein